MHRRNVVLLLALALAAGCKEPGDPPNPEVPGPAPVVPEPGMTTGQPIEAVNQSELGSDSLPPEGPSAVNP